ncbi:MAG: UbiH/UbiF/VisC/COQ6 family ubiquinone biosynthesis hydroxylase [Pseudomonadota bacterium]
MAELAQFDLVIVGAGIAGCALAAALSGNGLKIALVEAQPLAVLDLPRERNLASYDPRVSAITPRSQSHLASMGVWNKISDYRLCSYQHMTVWDAEGTGRIDFDRNEVEAPCLGHIIENRAIVNSLLQYVTSAADVKIFPQAIVQDCKSLMSESMMSVELADGTALRAQLLVAADGARSQIRTFMGFATREWEYGHSAIVATVQVEHSHRETCWQRFLTSGPLAFLPLPGSEEQHYCSIVWSVKNELAEPLMQLSDAAFAKELEQSIESCLGKVLGCSRRFNFPLRQRHARNYVRPGVALVADAAHTIHPLAGQGVNLGLQDVAVLAEELLAGYARGLNLGDLRLLQRYQRRRKGENLMMMAAMDGFKSLFEQESLSIRWLRNTGLRAVGQLGPVKQQLIRHAMGLA